MLKVYCDVRVDNTVLELTKLRRHDANYKVVFLNIFIRSLDHLLLEGKKLIILKDFAVWLACENDGHVKIVGM